MLVAVFAAALGLVAAGGQPAQATASDSGLRFWPNGMCVDTGLQDRTKVILFDCHGRTNQRFNRTGVNVETATAWFRFQSLHSDMCLGAAESTFSGLSHRVLMRPCGDVNQVHLTTWRLVFAYNPEAGNRGWYAVLQNTVTHGCMGVDPLTRPQNGTTLMTSPCPGFVGLDPHPSFRMKFAD
jgi:hypothetical protein